MKTYAKYGFGLIAIYLVVANGSKFGTAVRAGANGTGTVIKAFQGR
ncbi:hypothetical protein [Pimelobacter simplex]|nr:hypothetical protein [Pimelobacter simplex]